MDSESRRMNWLLKPLFFIYIMVCLFFLFKNNPYLYSTETLKGVFHKEKEDSIYSVPAIESHQENLHDLDITYKWRQDFARTGAYNEQFTYGRKYEKVWTRDLWINGSPDFKKANFISDESGYYLTAHSSIFVKTDTKGELLWKLELADPQSIFSSFPVLTKKYVFVNTLDGRIFCLNKTTGRILWTTRPVNEIRSSLVLVEGRLSFFGVQEEIKKKTNLFQANPWNGAVTQVSNEDVGPINPHPPTVNEDLNVLYVANEEGNLFAINYDSGKLLFKTSTSDKILSSSLFAQKKVLFTTQDGKLVAVDARTGNLIWETDLEAPADQSPSLLPTFDAVVVMTNNGYLETVDLKTGEKLWKFLANSEGTQHNTSVLRLNSKAIEQLDLKWKNKGYVILAPCTGKKICIYSPDKGKILGRIYLDGEMVSEPIFEGKDMLVTVKVSDEGELKIMKLKESGSDHPSVSPAHHNQTKQIKTPGET